MTNTETPPANEDVDASAAVATVSGADYEKQLTSGAPPRSTRSRVTGEVKATGAVVRVPLEIRDAEFHDRVSLSLARLERGATISNCTFRAGLSLAGCRVKGPLVLDRVTIGVPQQPASQPSEDGQVSPPGQPGGAQEQGDPFQTIADFSDLRVDGCLKISSTKIHGNLLANYTTISDYLSFDGVRIDGDLRLRRATLGELLTDARKVLLGASSATSSSDAKRSNDDAVTPTEDQATAANGAAAEPAVPPRTGVDQGSTQSRAEERQSSVCSIGGQLDLTSATLAGDLRLQGVDIGGELVLQAARIGGNLLCRSTKDDRARIASAWLYGMHVDGTIDFSRLTTTEGGIQATETSCGANWTLNGVTLEGELVVQGVTIGGSLSFRTVDGFSPRVAGDVRLLNMRTVGPVEFIGAQLEKSLVLENCDVGSDVFVVFDLLESQPDWRKIDASVAGPIKATYSRFAKRVIITATEVGSALAKDGPSALSGKAIEFLDVQIGSSLTFDNRDLALENLDAKAAEVPPRIPSGEQRLKLVADCDQAVNTIHGDFVLKRCTIAQDVRLSCARIEGNLDVRYTRVAGRLELFSSGDAADNAPAVSRSASVAGQIMLDDMTASEVALCGCSAEPTATRAGQGWKDQLAALRQVLCDAWGRDRHYLFIRRLGAVIWRLVRGGDPEPKLPEDAEVVSLERANIVKLKLVDPLPHYLRLSGVRVGHWEGRDDSGNDRALGLDDTHGDTTGRPPRPTFFEEVLERSRPFGRSSYLGVSSYLRNLGRDEEADRVLVHMRQRERRYLRGFDVVKNRLLDMATLYWTDSKRVAIFLGLWLLFSVAVFHFGDNVEYKIYPSAASPELPLVVHPKEDKDWNIWDAALFAVHLHVPVVALGVDEVVMPSGTFWRTYAIIATAFSWVAWALILTTLSGVVKMPGKEMAGKDRPD